VHYLRILYWWLPGVGEEAFVDFALSADAMLSGHVSLRAH
jgi:hypothetical protein